jgi:hypothetical protein
MGHEIENSDDTDLKRDGGQKSVVVTSNVKAVLVFRDVVGSGEGGFNVLEGLPLSGLSEPEPAVYGRAGIRELFRELLKGVFAD